ncbi:kinase-like domain-containing protein, partial [Baffinella frigidus]
FEIDRDTFCTVLSICTEADLERRLLAKGAIPEAEARAITRQVLSGLAYLSKHKVIHYDLKPANIMFDSTGQVRLTDFGLSRQLGEGAASKDAVQLSSVGAGTAWFAPPRRVDVWSMGVILYEMLFGKRPYAQNLNQ